MMEKKRTAVVLLELQNDFLAESGKIWPLVKPVPEANNVIANLNDLILGAHHKDMHVIHVPIQFSKDYVEMGPAPTGILKIVKDSGALTKGTWGVHIAQSIVRVPGDIVIEGKSHIDAFVGTNLDFFLRSQGITRIAIAGNLTNICVESTIRSAYDRGYEVIGITMRLRLLDKKNTKHRSTTIGQCLRNVSLIKSSSGSS